MIKLTIELKDDKFIFDYEVGGSKHHCDANLSVDNFVVFSDFLKIVSTQMNRDMKFKCDMLMVELEKKQREK